MWILEFVSSSGGSRTSLCIFITCFPCVLIVFVCTDHWRDSSPSSVSVAHLGDYNSSIHLPGYLAESQFIPDQSDDFLKKVELLHEQHRWEGGRWRVAYFWKPRFTVSKSHVFCCLMFSPLLSRILLSGCQGFLNLEAVWMVDQYLAQLAFVWNPARV